MNTINIIILEDEYLARLQLIQFVDQLPDLKLLGAYATLKEVLHCSYIEQCDLFLLDINLPDGNGLEFAKQIPKKSIVIFTTAYSEFAVEGFNLHAADYLLKPIQFERFKVAIQKAKNQISLLNKQDKHIILKQGRDLIRCNLNDVLYIKGMEEYLYWKLTSDKIITLGSLTSYAEALEQNHFVRTHKSYIVNLKKVDSISTKAVFINEEPIPIGKMYADNLKKLFTKF